MKLSELVIILGFILSIIIWFVSIPLGSYKLFPSIPQETASVIASISLSILSLFVAEKVSSMISARETDKELQDINKILKSITTNVEMEYMGNALIAARSLNDILRNAVSVKNTYIVAVSPRRRTRIVDYTAVEGKNIIRNVTNFIKEGKKWCDVVSLTGKERLEGLGEAFRTEGIDFRENYDAYLINQDFPIVNFIILEYEDGIKEVYFGWGMHEIQPLADVFRSENVKIVEYFERYFDTLTNIGIWEDMNKYISNPEEDNGDERPPQS